MVSDFRPHESYQFFLQEVPELLQTLETGLLDLQQDHTPAKMHMLMRAAHSLKGGAACVGLSQIQTLAHQLETVLKTCSEADIAIDLELEDLILQAFDCLKLPLLEEIQTGHSDDIVIVAASNPVWQELKAKLTSASTTGSIEPTAASQPLDFAQAFLFIPDIARGLKRLRTLLAQPETPEIAVAICTQLEIFQGLGEIAELPSLVEVSTQSLRSLKSSPSQLQQIGQATVAQLDAIYTEVQRSAAAHQSQVSLQTHPETQAHSEPAHSLPKPAESIPDPAAVAWWRQYQRHAGQNNLPNDSPSQALIPLQLSLQPAQKPVPHSLGWRQDWARLDLLSNLVSELVTQDNRLRSQQEQQVETVELLSQCFNRVRQLSIGLNRWAQQQPVSPARDPDKHLSHSSLNRSSLNRSSLNRSSLNRSNRGQDYLQTTAQSIVEELAQLGEAIQDLMLLDQQMQQIAKQKQKTLKQVQGNLLQTRMLPISELLNQFPRMVRDLATTHQKPVTLELEGKQTLVDKAILEKLYDPLVHLVRNAFDHGIEPPEVRQVLGKPEQGKIKIRAWHRGNQTYIEVQDDGQGIDLEHLRTTAIARQLISATEAQNLPEHRLYELLFSPGFSTADQVSNLSGRGMGLYAVQSQLSALKGVVSVDSKLGKGTAFTLRLPLTLTITKLLVFSIQDNLLAIPVDMLEAITVASEQLFQTQHGRQFYYWQNRFVPVFPEALLLTYRYPRIRGASDKGIDNQDEAWRQLQKFPLLLLSHGTEIIALKIDQIVLEQDLIIKPFNEAITPPAGLSGCTILADGRLAPVLDGSALIEKWLQMGQTAVLASNTPISTIPTILVVDDSLTLRHALSTTLSKAGYQVIQAKDGWEAVAQLGLHSEIAAVICDIEMPRMTGLEFLSRCQQQGISIPVIVLTYRSSEKYRQLAKQLGAAAYLTKPYLDKELLQTLEVCLTAAR